MPGLCQVLGSSRAFAEGNENLQGEATRKAITAPSTKPQLIKVMQLKAIIFDICQYSQIKLVSA